MKLLQGNKIGWLGGFALGVLIADTVHDGWAAVVLLGVYMLGRWVFASIASMFFAEELTALKKVLAINDPIKRSIWNHVAAHHDGSWRDCQHTACIIQ